MPTDVFFEVLRALVIVAALWLLGVWLVVSCLSIVLGAAVLLMLPATYFRDDGARPEARPWWSPVRLVRTGVGGVLVALGAVLSLPGVPGQGLLTIVVGLRLIDAPARRRIEQALVGRRGVLPNLNRLRARFGQPPLLPPQPTAR